MDETDRGDFDPLRQKPAPSTGPPAQEEDYQAASEDVRKLDRGLPPDYHKPKRDRRTVYILAGVLFAVLLAGAGSYWYLNRHKAKNTPAPTATSQTTGGQAASAAPAQLINPKTKSYTSSNFGLAFSYPEDWTVTDSGNGSLSTKSPTIKLKDPSGQSFSGQIVFLIRDHAQKLTEFDKGNAIATRDSQKLAYTKPTQTQRANTYASYVVYAGGSGLQAIYITGDNGYQKGQNVPAADISKVDPIINLAFLDSSGKQAGIQDSMMDDSSFAGPLKQIIESLSIN